MPTSTLPTLSLLPPPQRTHLPESKEAWNPNPPPTPPSPLPTSPKLKSHFHYPHCSDLTPAPRTSLETPTSGASIVELTHTRAASSLASLNGGAVSGWLRGRGVLRYERGWMEDREDGGLGGVGTWGGHNYPQWQGGLGSWGCFGYRLHIRLMRQR